MRQPAVLALIAVAVIQLGSGDASAQSKKSTKSRQMISRCVKMSQQKAGDSGLELALSNRCQFPVACTLSWQLVCERQGETKRRTRHDESAQLSLADGESTTTTADASTCGDESWAIRRVKWSCEQSDDGAEPDETSASAD